MIAFPAFAFLAVAAVGQPPQPEPEPDYGEIVVTGSRVTPLAPLLEPIEYFRRYCFDALRLRGRLAAPDETDSDWQPAPAALRERLRIDPASAAFVLSDPQRGHTLLLNFEHPRRQDRLHESRCRLVMVGGTGHAELDDGMFKLFHGAGTERHVGHPDGSPRLSGWRERLWIAIPRRGSTRWRVYGGFVRVLSQALYDRSDYLMGDLKQSVGRAPAVSIITLSFTSRTERRVR